MRRLSRGDWLLSTSLDLKSDNSELSELSIFALVLETRKTFTKIARWQAFGRLRLSNATLPTALIKLYYKKIGEISLDPDDMSNIDILLSSVPEKVLNERNSKIFEYDKALYNSCREKKTLEAILAERGESQLKGKFEVAILKCFEAVNPESEDSKSLLVNLVKSIEKIYEDNGYTIYRSIAGNVEDVVKNK